MKISSKYLYFPIDLDNVDSYNDLLFKSIVGDNPFKKEKIVNTNFEIKQSIIGMGLFG